MRGAIETAIEKLNAEKDIIEPEREVTLDHDRKDVPGSPDLARVILEKIAASNVFIADVTPVGETASDPPKMLINSNVAIELGYSLATVTDRGLIMVMNRHFGDRADLPFDLAHKAGPIFYSLAPGASKDEIRKAAVALAGELKIALAEIIAESPRSAAEQYREVPPFRSNPAIFLQPGSKLVHRQGLTFDEEQNLTVPSGALLYLRVMPNMQMSLLKRVEARRLVQELRPLYPGTSGSSIDLNEQGAISFEANFDDKVILTGVQLFLQREIWGFDSVLLRRREGRKSGVPTQAVEEAFRRALPHYLNFSVDKLGLTLPLVIEAGAYPVKGHILFMPPKYFDQQWGPIQQDHIRWRGEISSTSNGAMDVVLLEIFEAFFDAGGVSRPKSLYGFTPQQVA